jgi:uncharacterized protein YggE
MDRITLMRRHLSIVLIAAALALPAAGGWAQTQPEARERLLSVSGEGSVTAHPDIALITLGVVSEAESARDALADNNESMTRVLDALKAEGLQPRDLQTSGFSVEPVYSQQPRNYEGQEPFRPEIVGYRVRNNLTVRIRDLERVGAILDQVVTLGANSISGPTFTVAEPAQHEDAARRAAVEEALRKARLYADAAGVELGPILRIEDGYSRPPEPIQPGTMMRMEAAASPVPIEGGELTFQAQVSVSWLLAD